MSQYLQIRIIFRIFVGFDEKHIPEKHGFS